MRLIDFDFDNLAYTNRALVSSVYVPGQTYVLGFIVYSSKAAAQWLHFWDGDRVPAAGTAPDMAFPLGAHDYVAVFYGPPGRPCASGFVLANSTTETTYTAGLADCFFDVQYLGGIAGRPERIKGADVAERYLEYR